VAVSGVEGGDGERKEEKIGGKKFGEERMAEVFLSWFSIFYFFKEKFE
jgi:hypothetical protein